MIRYKKALKKDLPMLVEYKLLTITPYIKEKNEQLKAIAYVNNFIMDNYKECILIYSFLKPIGAYLIKDKELDTLYIKDNYQNKGIGSKVLEKIKDEIDKIKVKKENKNAIQFYQKNGFKKEGEKEDYLILRKEEKNENELIFKTNSKWYQNNK